MKEQLFITLNRLRKPTVLLSIVSQIITIMTLLNISVDADAFTSIAVSVCSVLVTLGIMSNPTTIKKGFGDDIEFCKNCKIKTEHALIGDKLICKGCGTVAKDKLIELPEIKL